MNLGGALTGALGGLLTGGPLGAAIGGIGALLGGGGAAGGGGLDNTSMMSSQQQNMQNLMFQQQVNLQSQQFTTLSNAQKAMHDAIMALLSNAAGDGSGSTVTQPTKTGSGASLFPPVSLNGPDFGKSAAAIAKTSKVNSIALLQVNAGTGTPVIQTLAGALSSLRIYFTAKADVFLNLPAGMVTTALRQQLQMACGAQVTVNPTPYQQVQLQQLK